jgi:hypothetical protein
MRLLLIGLAVVLLAAGVVGAQRLAARSPGPAGGRPPGLDTATVARQDLVSRERVNGTLGYDQEYDIANQYTPGIGAAQAASLQDAVSSARTAVDDAVSQAGVTNQIDADTVAGDQIQLAQDQEKLAADATCGTSRPDAACAQDQTAVNSDQAKLTKDQNQQRQDQIGGRARVDQARATLTQAQDSLAAAESGSPGSGGQGQGGSGGGGGAIVTWLPAEGSAVDRGQPLYDVAGRPIPLFTGDQPFGRPLKQGVGGHDVQELEQNLVALGYGRGLAADGSFTSADAAAVSRWQQALGAPATGVVNPGDAVVLPGAVRVEQLKTSLGSSIQAGAPVMVATSTAQVVNVSLDANLQSQAHVGDPVEVTLPDGGRTVNGKVTSVARVATPTQPSPGTASSGSGEPSATVAVTIGLDDPAAGGALDQAPVTVSIISQSVKGALTVPISALLAQQSGGSAVEVVDAGGHTRLVPVQTGLFDDQDSLVQVSSTALREGEKVEVPSLS